MRLSATGRPANTEASSRLTQMSLLFGWLDWLVRALVKGALYLAAAFTVLLAILGATDVVGAQFLGKALPSAFEYQEVLMGMIVFGGMASVQLDRAHITVDIVTSALHGVTRKLADVLTLSAGSLLFTILSIQNFELASRSYAIRELSPGFVAFPLYPIKIFVFICCCICLAEFARQLVRRIIFFRHENYL